MKRYFACAALIACVALGTWSCWRNTPRRDTTTLPPDRAATLPLSGAADLGQARLGPDRSPTHVVDAPRSTAVAAEGIAVQGTLQLDAEAGSTPSTVVIEITCTMPPDGRTVVANAGLAKTEPLAGQNRVYRFETVIKAPLKAGKYQIVGKFHGKPFSKGTLDVKKKTENGKTGRR